jgi:hypothetical protein
LTINWLSFIFGPFSQNHSVTLVAESAAERTGVAQPVEEPVETKADEEKRVKLEMRKRAQEKHAQAEQQEKKFPPKKFPPKKFPPKKFPPKKFPPKKFPPKNPAKKFIADSP